MRIPSTSVQISIAETGAPASWSAAPRSAAEKSDPPRPRVVVEPSGAGTLFGIAIVPGGGGVYFVDDGDNTLKVLH